MSPFSWRGKHFTLLKFAFVKDLRIVNLLSTEIQVFVYDTIKTFVLFRRNIYKQECVLSFMFISRLVIEGKDDGVEAINSNFDSYGSDVTFDGFSLVYEGDADDAYWSLPSQFLGNIVRTRTTGVFC